MKVGGGGLFFSTDPKCLWAKHYDYQAQGKDFNFDLFLFFLDNILTFVPPLKNKEVYLLYFYDH